MKKGGSAPHFDVAELDASRCLDTVRGMLICRSMVEATTVVHVLQALALHPGDKSSDSVANTEHSNNTGTGADCMTDAAPFLDMPDMDGFSGFLLERSKNRFVSPSDGGWMDCLVNLRLVGGPADGLVCEVQIVHHQLLTVRAELGAHHSYNTYRAAAEMLEVVGLEKMVSNNEHDAKKEILGTILAECVDADGDPIDPEQVPGDITAQLWSVCTALPGRAWPMLLHLELPGQVVGWRGGSPNAQTSGLESVVSGSTSSGSLASAFLKHVHGVGVAGLPETLAQSAIAGPLKVLLTSHEIGKHQAGVFALAVSPDGKYLVSGTNEDDAAHVWDLANETLVQNLRGHSGAVSCVCVGADSKSVYTGSFDSTVRVWGALCGTCRRTLRVSAGVLRIALSADDTHLAVLSTDGVVGLWTLGTFGNDATTSTLENAGGVDKEKPTQVLKGHEGIVNAVCFASQGQRVITCGDDKTVRCWQTATGTLQRTIWGHVVAVRDVCATPDSKCIVTASDDIVRVWAMDTGERLHGFSIPGDNVRSICLSADGRYLFTSTLTKSRVWHFAEGDVVRELPAGQSSACFAADGQSLFASSDATAVRRFAFEGDGSRAQVLSGDKADICALCVTYDGEFVVCGSVDGSLHMWELRTGSLVQVLNGHTDRILSVCVSPDAKFAVSTSKDRTLRVWALAASAPAWDGGAVVTTIRELSTSVCITPDSQHVVVGSNDGKAYVHSLGGSKENGGGRDRDQDADSNTQGTLVRTLQGHKDAVRAVCVTTDGQRVVTGSMDRTIRVFDFESGKETQRPLQCGSAVGALCLTADCLRVVAAGLGDGVVSVWSLLDGALMGMLEHKNKSVLRMCLTRDQKHLVAASGLEATVWDLASQAVVRTFAGHGGTVECVGVDPCGKYLLMAVDDKLKVQVMAAVR